MSITQTITPDQQQLFAQLSQQFKTPLRNVIGEMEEVVQNTISNLIQQIVVLNKHVSDANKEINRLKKLCDDNKINWNLEKTVSDKPSLS